MKKINAQATRIFCRLIKKLNVEGYAKLSADGFMPLVIEVVGENISTPYGMAKLYSVAHYYEQNGDLMSDPQMVFIVVDGREDEKDFDAVAIFPQTFQQDNLGIYEESILIKESKMASYKKHWYDGHVSFANIWLRNISQRGFLKH